MPVRMIFVFFLSCLLNRATVALGQEWKEKKGEHFIIYFVGDAKFANDVSDYGEIYYQRIASDLGYPRHSEFWTWDKRVKIYIHPDRASYLKAAGQPSWSEGMTDYNNRQIISYAWHKNFIESLLPHEITHLIFRDFVGFSGEIPVWLDEGVAQWEEGQATQEDIRKKARELYDKDALLSLRDITRLNVKLVDENEKRLYFRGVHTKDGRYVILVLSPDVLISRYYIEAGSLIGFLITSYGANRFTEFCRQMRDGKSIEEAFSFAYAEQFPTIDELEKMWKRYLEKSPTP